MSQEDELSFSEMRRKQERMQGGTPHPAGGDYAANYGHDPARRMRQPPHSDRPLHPAGADGVGDAPVFSIRDFYYICFRHKWKIIMVFLAGIVGAAGFYSASAKLYQSDARILIRYILEARTAGPGVLGGADSQIKSPDSPGNNIINSEIQILTSFDLAKQVADTVGAEKLLARAGGARGDGEDRARAAGVVSGGLSVEALGGSVLRIVFRHPDPAVVQPVLNTLVETYLKRHVEIHQGVGVMDDFFLRQADQLRTRLGDTEEKLKKLKADAQIISVEDSKRAYFEQISRIQGELLLAGAELSERRAALDSLTQSISTNAPNDAGTNPVAEISLSADVIDRYRTAVAELELLAKRRSALRTRYLDEHFLLRSVNAELAEAEAAKRELESEYPSLVTQAVAISSSTNRAVDFAAEAMRVNTLQVRIKVLTSQLETLRSDANRVAEAEPAIIQLQRMREVDEANYRSYATMLERQRLDDSLGAGKITNISLVQAPTPPMRYATEMKKPLLIILMLGCFGGFAWGFVSDRFLNQTVKRVVDVERHLPVPLFASVPDLGWRGNLHLLKASHNGTASSAAAPEADGHDSNAPALTALAAWDPRHKLRPYYEGLRDRLITYFEVREMRHKPKMVAVTGCAHGAGVTTMAAGLAAALSETGDGNVLLVDMNLERGAAHPFFQGKPAGVLSDALENTTRDPAQMQENLYVVGIREPKNQQLPSVLPKRFAHLVPKMKASDYDYIIFDMPPVTQTSVTARLAGFMDMVLVVVESEKTDPDLLKRVHGLLNESRPAMAAVLNKHRAYVPPQLAQEL